MSDTTKEDKEITMYPEDLTVDCDEVTRVFARNYDSGVLK